MTPKKNFGTEAYPGSPQGTTRLGSVGTSLGEAPSTAPEEPSMSQFAQPSQPTAGSRPQSASQQNVGQKAKEAVSSVADSQMEKTSGGLEQVAQALRKTGEHLRGNQQEGIATYSDKAAEKIDRFSQMIRSKNFRNIFEEVEGWARREPGLFLGGAFALGLLGARFLKSSGRQSSSDYGSNFRRGDNNRREFRSYGRSAPTAGYSGLGRQESSSYGESGSRGLRDNEDWPISSKEH